LADNDIIKFIRSCIKRRKVLWSYHVNMRLKERFITRGDILSSLDTFEIIEEYPKDKYLPSYLIYAKNKKDQIFHIQIAVDIDNDSVTIITAYKPNFEKWDKDFKTRRSHDLP